MRDKPTPIAPKATPLTAELVQNSLIDLTPEFARFYLALKEFEGERSIDPRRVDELFDEMVDVRFNWDNVNIATAEFLGATYKINSQHTMSAYLETEDTSPKKVRHLHYRCRTLEEMKTLYSTFDRNRPRTNAHITAIGLAGTPIASLVSKRMLGLLGPAYALYLNSELSATQRAQTIQQFHDLSARLGAFDKARKVGAQRFMKRASIVAAMLAIFARNTDPESDAAADEFWSHVTEGVMLQPGSAEYSLHQYLDTHYLNAQATGRKKTAPHLVVSPEDMYRVCLRAWNHHCVNRAIKPQAFRAGKSRPDVYRWSDAKAMKTNVRDQDLVAC